MTPEQLFRELFAAGREADVDALVQKHERLFASSNWRPYGGNDNNFGVVENQQASPIPALAEKVINAIDAVLMRRCLEEGIDPRSSDAPQSVPEAVRRFFPDSQHWDLGHVRRAQAERIQIVADGPKRDTSVIIYDEGEGQHPEDFERTFLSLLRGNKNEIHFVQGKYNMGGAGAIVFCGRQRYQLVGSKRHDGTGRFGFTLLRRHPLQGAERQTKKSTWYEYLTLDGVIPSFEIDELDLGLHNRRFRTGTVIKLYSYDLPGISDLSRDLTLSLNEYLFNPALPLYVVEKAERYPKQQRLERPLQGLRYRLEESGSRKYLAEEPFSEEREDARIGRVKVTCYVFKPRVDELSTAETRKRIRDEFFVNNMSVLFTLNGQVHGSFTSEFITRSLKFPLLKDWLLIHVDCTDVSLEVRNELFMASRDRLKEGDESRRLRQLVAEMLKRGRLKEIHKERKDAITVDAGKDTQDLLRSVTRQLPLNSDLARLLDQTFRLGRQEPGKGPSGNGKEKALPKPPPPPRPDAPPFIPRRFPSFFRLEGKTPQDGEGIPTVKLPLGGQRTIRFSTDAEDQYFDRTSEPGKLQIAVLDYSPNQSKGGNAPGLPDRPSGVLDVVKSSPSKGTIRVTVSPTQEVSVGDAVRVRACLSGAGEEFDQVFWVRITDPEKPPKEPEPEPVKEPELGLPELIRVSRSGEGVEMAWEQLDSHGIEIGPDVVVHPQGDGEKLTSIYLNMDSSAFLTYRAKYSGEKALQVAEKRYVTSVYFHTLFLYAITRSQGFSVQRAENGHGDTPVSTEEYIRDLFRNHYSAFLLNFDTADLLTSLEE